MATTTVDLRIDFGAAKTASGYNNLTIDDTVPKFLFDFATGLPTQIQVEILSPFDGYFTNIGTTYPVDELGIPQEVAEDALYGSEATEPTIIEFTGLDVNTQYDMLFFASRMWSDEADNLETQFKLVGGTQQTVWLDAANNISATIGIDPISPKTDGSIHIEIRRGEDNTTDFYWLSSISLWSISTDEPQPPEPPIDRPLRPGEPPPSEWNYEVTNYNELKAALSEARSGDVIHIVDTAEIDMTGKGTLTIKGGVTLASSRTVNGSWGAIIYTTDKGHYPMINVTGPNARISGLRLRGADTTTQEDILSDAWEEGGDEAYEQYPYTCGITMHQNDFEIDNCELWGWTHAAIIVGGKNAMIRNNYFHHCQRWGLGYGVCMSGDGYAKIIRNYWDFNRHSIAGTGTYGQGYEASGNIVMQHATSHAFDMHSGEDRGDGTLMAGSIVNIHHNVFYVRNQLAFYTEGAPTDFFSISNNRFVHEDFEDAVYLKLGPDIVEASGNVYNIPDKEIHPPYETDVPPDEEV